MKRESEGRSWVGPGLGLGLMLGLMLGLGIGLELGLGLGLRVRVTCGRWSGPQKQTVTPPSGPPLPRVERADVMRYHAQRMGSAHALPLGYQAGQGRPACEGQACQGEAWSPRVRACRRPRRRRQPHAPA